MKKLLCIVLFSLTLAGCSTIIIVHEEGELPRIDIEGIKDFCNEKSRAKINNNKIQIICAKKLP